MTPPSTSASTSPTALDRGNLEDWELITIEVDQTELLVAVADDPGERAQGLMGVEDLGSVDGMLFVFPSDTTGFFWMKDTLIALDIAFFASDGLLVEVMTMEPCVSDPCPRYQAGVSYRWALETAAGDLADLSETARLTFPLANP
ncbi:MAG TPA: DUF192 domain-containing protein [Acidimicrobiia bacterium]|nr:DUF192 domain-containing protein [Acidimicrobiia bacterium]